MLDCGAGVELGAVGVGVAGAGVTGAVFAGAGLETFSRTDPPVAPALSTRSTKAIAQTMNMIAHQVVA